MILSDSWQLQFIGTFRTVRTRHPDEPRQYNTAREPLSKKARRTSCGHPFSEPTVSPSMSWRWKMRKTAIIGTVTTVSAANSRFRSVM